jgi:hypothetical protein
MPYPNPAQVASSADLSNVVAMVDEAYALALAIPEIAWGGQTEWNFPDPNDPITPPHLAVVFQGQLEYRIGGQPAGEWLPPAMESMNYWVIGVYALWPYEIGNVDTYVTPLDAALRFQRTFKSNPNLGGQCDELKVGLVKTGPVAERRPGDPPMAASGPIRWQGGYVLLVASEELFTDYAP